jgi:hypothetical protein
MTQIGDTLFVHGGLLPTHLKPSPAQALKQINTDMSAFFTKGGTKPPSTAVRGGALWLRTFSGEPDEKMGKKTCALLQQTLKSLPQQVSRMVVGHSPQPDGRITSACGGSVWRVDAGMSKGTLKSVPQALEILPGGKVRVLVHNSSARGASDSPEHGSSHGADKTRHSGSPGVQPVLGDKRSRALDDKAADKRQILSSAFASTKAWRLFRGSKEAAEYGMTANLAQKHYVVKCEAQSQALFDDKLRERPLRA